MVLKFYRRFEPGPHPDLDLTRFLSIEQKVPHVARYAGAIHAEDSDREGAVALLVEYTVNQGDGWSYTLDALTAFSSACKARARSFRAQAAEMIGGVYPERARQLGSAPRSCISPSRRSRSGSISRRKDSARLYQRSLYQAMRSSAGRVARQLRRELARYPPTRANSGPRSSVV